MNLLIGVVGVQREIQMQVEMSESELLALVEAADSEGKTLRLEDRKGRKLMIPARHLGYVLITDDQPRRVGFTVS